MKTRKRTPYKMTCQALGAGLLALAVLGGCSEAHKTDGAPTDLEAENASLRAQRDQAVKDAQTARADLNRVLASTRTPAEHGAGPTGLEGTAGVTTGKTAAGEDQIEIEGDVLFDTAKATIKPAFKKTLDKIASVMQSQYDGRTFRVEGHTDPRPVRSSGWDDNWDLGAARARAVTLYLISKGVPKKDVYIASFADNDLRSTTDYAQDRRVDIIVTK